MKLPLFRHCLMQPDQARRLLDGGFPIAHQRQRHLGQRRHALFDGGGLQYFRGGAAPNQGRFTSSTSLVRQCTATATARQ